MNKRDLRLQQREAERRNRLLGGVLTVPSASPLLPALQQRRQQQAEFKAAYLRGLHNGGEAGQNNKRPRPSRRRRLAVRVEARRP